VDDSSDFLPAYSGWFGKSVVLLFVIRQCHIPIPRRIVGESATDLRIQLQPHACNMTARVTYSL
jgi:hypothetical protein